MKITHETRRESYEQLDPSGRKAAILAELERGDGTALEIMRRMGFTDPNRVRPRLNELDRAGYIFQVGKRRDPYTGVEGVIYSKKSPARATNTDKASWSRTKRLLIPWSKPSRCKRSRSNGSGTMANISRIHLHG